MNEGPTVQHVEGREGCRVLEMGGFEFGIHVHTASKLGKVLKKGVEMYGFGRVGEGVGCEEADELFGSDGFSWQLNESSE